jgi:hypothetical protein
MRSLLFTLLIAPLVVFGQEGQVEQQDTIPDYRSREDQFYAGFTYNLVTDVPGGINNEGLSGGVHFGFLRDMPVNEQRNIAIAVGVGLSFNRYGQNLFIGEEKDSENTIFRVLDRVDYNSNSLHTTTFEFPVEFRWRTSTATDYKFWRIYAGLRMGYTVWYRAKFKQTGNDINQTDIPEFQPLRTGLSLSVGYNTFNFFVYYSINPFFKDAETLNGQSVDFRTIKLGLMFYIL